MDNNSYPDINLNLCNSCGVCVVHCPETALTLTGQGPVFKNPNTCTYCAICEEVCATNAIRVPFTVSWKA